MLTIREIARLAGVSKSTVSRVLNNKSNVSSEKKKIIEEIIREYKYKPSAAAVTLSKKESTIIGVVIPEIDNQFFGEIIKGITEEADKSEFSLICCDTQNSGEKEQNALSILQQQRVRGVIITPALGYGDTASIEKFRTALERINAPIVIVDRDFDYSQWDTVYFQNYESGYIATDSLIKAGNRRIGIIQGDMQLKIARERFRGFQDAMMNYQYPIRKEDILIGDFTKETAYKLTLEMIDRGDLPDAMVTSNNRTSVGFIKALIERGLQIGRDIALIGIDRVPILDDLGLGFSYVSRDTEEMGRLSMKLLKKRLKEPDEYRNIWVVPCSLELNGSESKSKQ